MTHFPTHESDPMMLPNTNLWGPVMTMMIRRVLLLGYALLMVGCQNFPARGPVINSGSYDWTDQVRDGHGFPVPGWYTAIAGPR